MTRSVHEAHARYHLGADAWPQFWPTERPVSAWHYYRYEHIDTDAFMHPARPELPQDDADMILRQLGEGFRRKGWEGDGDIAVFWLPPFMSDRGDSAGFLAFHVKQRNNGTSYIASPFPLPGLEDQ